MMIEDSELRDIYKIASTERIQKIEAALMHLEQHPQDRGKIDEILREAHTFKGDSGMLGVQSVEKIVHRVEDLLTTVKQSHGFVSPALCDRLYRAIDAIRQLSHEAVTGEAVDVDVFSVLAQLMGINSAEKSASSAAADSEELFGNDFDELEDDLFSDEPMASSREAMQAEPASETASAELDTAAQVSDYQIDTIRVEPHRLDALLRQAGELNVAKGRISLWLKNVEEVVALWEELSQTILTNGSLNRLQTVTNGKARYTEKHLRIGELLHRIKKSADGNVSRLETLSHEIEAGVQSLRLLPLSTIFNLFPRLVRDLSKQQGKDVKFVIEGGDTRADKRILEEIKDPLLHILRNAIDHGIETPSERESSGKPATATLRLRGYQSGSRVRIEVIDDGRGLDLESIKRTALKRGVCRKAELAVMSVAEIHLLIFAPGFSTRTAVTEISGRGVGLDVVRANVERLKGSIEVSSQPGQGCQFRLLFNTTLATSRVLIVEVNQTPYALPIEYVETMLLLSRQEIFALRGNQTMTFKEQPVSVVWLADLLELPLEVPFSSESADATAKILPCVVIKAGTAKLGLLVDALVDEQEIFVKPQSKLLKRVRNVAGATILGTGEVCPVLNPLDMLKSTPGAVRSAPQRLVEATTKQSLLLVEDSIIIRTQLKRLLEGAGYDVTAAVDGLEGFNKLRAGNFDAVVSDVEMPNMTGLELVAKIRSDSHYSELPVILVTTLASDEDKRRGAEAGASAYLTKASFDQKNLLETLERLI
ncbi:MAG: response regulator [Cyanophyceae cyanobacterium]